MGLGSEYLDDYAFEIEQSLIRYDRFVEFERLSQKSDTEFIKLCRESKQKLEAEQRKTK